MHAYKHVYTTYTLSPTVNQQHRKNHRGFDEDLSESSQSPTPNFVIRRGHKQPDEKNKDVRVMDVDAKWACRKCTYLNSSSSHRCDVCECAKEEEDEVIIISDSDDAEVREGSGV